MAIQVHDLKIDPRFFEQVKSGAKTFEIRKNDRDYQEGDVVNLNEFDISIGVTDADKYTGRALIANIGFVTAYEQKDGYVVFSLIDVRDDSAPKAEQN